MSVDCEQGFRAWNREECRRRWSAARGPCRRHGGGTTWAPNQPAAGSLKFTGSRPRIHINSQVMPRARSLTGNPPYRVLKLAQSLGQPSCEFYLGRPRPAASRRRPTSLLPKDRSMSGGHQSCPCAPRCLGSLLPKDRSMRGGHQSCPCAPHCRGWPAPSLGSLLPKGRSMRACAAARSKLATDPWFGSGPPRSPAMRRPPRQELQADLGSSSE